MEIPPITYLAVDAGGTFLKSAVLNTEGEVLAGSMMSISSFSDGPSLTILQAFRRTIDHGIRYMSEHGLELGGIGIAFPGPFDIYRAVPLLTHKYKAIFGMDLNEFFRDLPGVPENTSFRFIHDAHAVLKGESWKGNAKDFDRVALVTIGTGLGFAISLDGDILQNGIGGPLVSIYRLPSGNVTLEDRISSRGIVNLYREMKNKGDPVFINVAEIGKKADEGDKTCRQTFRLAGSILAGALKDILIEREIECLLFGGQISKSFHHMERSLMDELAPVVSLKKISAVKYIDQAAFKGAIRDFLR